MQVPIDSGPQVCPFVQVAPIKLAPSKLASVIFEDEKFASIKEKAGFTESFYIPDRGTGYGTEDLEVKTKGEVATKAELQRAFKKHMGSKMTNKTILNAFIEQVA